MSASSLPSRPERAPRDQRGPQLLAEQIRLLYANANVGVGVNAIAATILVYLLLRSAPQGLIVGWWLYMLVVSAARFELARRYFRGPSATRSAGVWGAAFTTGAGLAGMGWGAAGILLYPEGHLTNQVILVFVLGGMMLGAAPLLAPRAEAFLAFLIPTGLGPGLQFVLTGDEEHLAMGLLAILFTAATLLTTYRIHLTIESSLKLQFENRDLVEDLQAAHRQAEVLNQELELRVQERTAELRASTERLRAEIAQREHMEDELLRARKLESLGVLAGGIAHDFNNFLTVILGNVEMVKMHIGSQEPVREILDETVAACRRGAQLSSQLLTFAKGGAPIRRVLSVAEIVLDAVRLARAGNPTTITVDIPENLWTAEVDAGQIGQVLHNILLNARQAMTQGGIIEVRARNVAAEANPDSGALVRISIQDYGCGIQPENLAWIFDPYFTTKPGNSGLGLATAYAIVAKHGGSLSVRSKPGEGSVFTVDLPASQEPPSPQVRPDARLHRGAGRILVMDDEETLRSLLGRILTSLGYETQTARDGAEAIALYEAARESGRGFSAVLLDLTVKGGMGGIEAAAKLREIDSSAKLIVSSGYSAAPVMAEYRKYGFDDVLPKPWTPAQVSEAFRRVLVTNPERKAN
jgi:signal transduction histidine kinase/CheY-like chemotaxis protein